MVATKILDEALRGGEPARQLEERCTARLKAAEATATNAISTAPDFLNSTRERHKLLMTNAESLNTELEMLGESLDDITVSSRQLARRAKLDASKKEALKELSILILPYVEVAKAIEASDDIATRGFEQLQEAHTAIEAAIATATESGLHQLVRTTHELEERADDVTAVMKSRFMDTFEIRPQTIIAIGRSIMAGTSHRNQVGRASASLAKCGLLQDAIKAIISELMRNHVANRIATATIFFQIETDSGCTLEWTDGHDASAELLEFDLDDIELIPDSEIDAMSEHLDISNSVARALKIYDLLRDHVVGVDYSRDLANAMRTWFAEHVLPPSVVLTSKREQHGTAEASRSALRSRVIAVSASAKTLQMALRARGASSFNFGVELDELESTVGAECRAQAVLAARRAIALFSNARHDDNDMVECPIAADKYIPRTNRPPEYFAPCLVTRTAINVHDTFLSTRKDATSALQSGSNGIGNAMNAAAVECLRSYREDVPVQHADDLRASLRLKALYYNDCMMFAHSARISAHHLGLTTDLKAEIACLEEAALKAMTVVRRTAEQRLMENLRAACRNSALGAYGTLTQIQRSSALFAAFNTMREVVSVFSDIVPTEIAEVAAGRLLQKYLTFLCSEVTALPEISSDGCDQIVNILRDADANVESLMDLVKGMNVVRAGAPPPDVIIQMRRAQKRLQLISEILNARMEDIATAFRFGKYEGLITRDEVEHFICSIFEDTPLRASFIQDLDVSVEQEAGEWGNEIW